MRIVVSTGRMLLEQSKASEEPNCQAKRGETNLIFREENTKTS